METPCKSEVQRKTLMNTLNSLRYNVKQLNVVENMSKELLNRFNNYGPTEEKAPLNPEPGQHEDLIDMFMNVSSELEVIAMRTGERLDHVLSLID